MSERITVDRAAFDALVASVEEVTSGEIVVTATTDTAVAAPEHVTHGPLIWGAKVSQTFRDRVWWISDKFTEAQGQFFDPDKLMACMAFESGESFSPSKKNAAGSGATGLIQFMPNTAKGLGTTTAALAKMTAEDQLNFVYKYFKDVMKARGPIVSLEDMYMAILLPSAVGKPDSHVLFSSGVAYRQNSGLDLNKDGKVTKFEAAKLVRDKFERGLQFRA